jgi:hypothetical protein
MNSHSRVAPAWNRAWCCCRLLSPFLLACLWFPAVTSAQTNAEGSIRGIVRDEQGAVLPGATVTAVSLGAPLPATAVSDGTGAYRLLTLLPGSYKVTVQLQGFSETVRDGIAVRAGLNIGLDLVLRVGSVKEAVSIVADAPLLESRRAGNSINVGGEFQRSLPLSARQHFYDFLQLAPGTVGTESPTFSDYWVNGTQSHVFQFDGADISAATSNRTAYLFGSSSVIEDVQVTTSGIEASAPLGQGAIVNVVTRSGTNAYKGDGILVFQPKSWNSNNNPGGTTSGYSIVQPDVSIGGPITRNRAWFFADYRYGRTHQSISRSASQLAAMRALDPDFQPFDNDVIAKQIFIKPTFQLSSQHRLQVFEQYGVDTEYTAAATDTAPFYYRDLGGHAASARLDSIWGSAITTRLSVVVNNQSNPNYQTRDDRPGRPVYQSAVVNGGVISGTGLLGVLDNYGSPPAYTAPATKATVTFDASYHKGDFFGSHEVQVGLLLQPRRTFAADFHYVNGGFVLEDQVLNTSSNPAGGYKPFRRRTYDDTTVTALATNSQDYGGYVQDEWRPTTRLTVSAGVRFDKILRNDRIFGDRIQDTTAIGPRLGLNYALTADRRNIVRMAAGIIHDATSTATQTTVGQNNGGYTDVYDTDLNGTFETAVHTPGLTQRTLNNVINLDTYRLPHSVDLSGGYARQLPGRVTIDASFLHRTFKDRTALIDTNGIYNGNVFAGYANPAFNEIYQVTANTFNWPVYSSFTLQAARDGARWQFVADYTRQFRHLEGTWQPNDPASFIQPTAFADDKGIGQVTSTTSNSLNGTAMTLTAPWQDHVARAAVSVMGPWKILVASSFMFQSGPWSGPVVTRIAAPDPQFGPTALTLSNGRVVQNPLATQIRFAYADRGEGQFHLPATKAFNLRLGRQFGLGHTQLDATAEVLNVLNGGVAYNFVTGANQLYNPQFGKGSQSLQPPRSVQGLLRLRF